MTESSPKFGDLMCLFIDNNLQLVVYLGEEETKYDGYALVIFDYNSKNNFDSNIQLIKSIIKEYYDKNGLLNYSSIKSEKNVFKQYNLSKIKEMLNSKLNFITSIEEHILTNGINITKLSSDQIEICEQFNINANDSDAQKEFRADLIDNNLERFLNILRKNTDTIKSSQVGDIMKMRGLTTKDRAIYHHHVILSDKDKFKIIHKWGEPGFIEMITSAFSSTLSKIAEVREDNIIIVAPFREIAKVTQFEEKYKDKIIRKLPEAEILERARARLGEKTYDITHDNCQHFCTSCCYDFIEGYERGISITCDKAKEKTSVLFENAKNNVETIISKTRKLSLHDFRKVNQSTEPDVKQNDIKTFIKQMSLKS